MSFSWLAFLLFRLWFLLREGDTLTVTFKSRQAVRSGVTARVHWALCCKVSGVPGSSETTTMQGHPPHPKWLERELKSLPESRWKPVFILRGKVFRELGRCGQSPWPQPGALVGAQRRPPVLEDSFGRWLLATGCPCLEAAAGLAVGNISLMTLQLSASSNLDSESVRVWMVECNEDGMWIC